MKQCRKCKKIKQLLDFGIDKTSKDGHNRYCKECMRNYKKGFFEKKKRNECTFDCLNCEFPDCRNLSAPIQPQESAIMRNIFKEA